MKKLIAIVLGLSMTVCAFAKLDIKQPCSDGMVLQQNTNAVVWGHATAGAQVTVTPSWDKKAYKVTTDSEGVWKAYVKTPAASYTNYKIKVKGDGGTMTINDVLIGEVWVASGQSNMEMPIRGFSGCPTEGAQEVIAAAAMPDKVRMCTIDIYQPDEPIHDVHSTRGWEKAGPATVSEMSATAFFFARQMNASLDVPIGILSLPRGGASVESWMPKELLLKLGEDLSEERMAKESEWSCPFRMYNGMQVPVQGYTAKGFIWYQGCTNVGRDEQFVERMDLLVKQWRKDWGDSDNSMPFYMCEIAPYMYTGGQEGKAALLRQAQHDAAKVIPNCGCIVTNDLCYEYEKHQIHPAQKRQVGERLAYMALHRNYGFERLACDSPEATGVSRPEAPKGFGNFGGFGSFGNGLSVALTNCQNGLNRSEGITGLEVAGEDGAWQPVTNVFCFGGNMMVISNVENPTQVRYGWGDFVPGNLKNAEGLPVAPFWVKLK